MSRTIDADADFRIFFYCRHAKVFFHCPAASQPSAMRLFPILSNRMGARLYYSATQGSSQELNVFFTQKPTFEPCQENDEYALDPVIIWRSASRHGKIAVERLG